MGSITWADILAVAGGITVIGTAAGFLSKWISPYHKLEKKVEKHDSKFQETDKELSDIKEATKVQNKVLLAIISHAITGNCVDKLREARDELQDYLINK